MATKLPRIARSLACSLVPAVLPFVPGATLAAGVLAQARIEPAVARPDAERLVRFALRVEQVPAPGLRSFAAKLRFVGERVALVPVLDPGAGTPAPAADKVTCSASLAAGAARDGAGDGGVTAVSGLGDLVLASQGSGSLLFARNETLGTAEVLYNAGIAGSGATPQVGSGALIEVRCYVGTAVPAGTSIAVVPELYPGLTGLVFLDQAGSAPVIDTLTPGLIQVEAAGNAAPVLAAVGDQQVAEGHTLAIPLSAADPDGNAVTLGVSGLPGFCAFVDNRISCTPGFTDAGTYPIGVTATDDGTPPKSASASFTLSVLNVNRAPVLDAIPDQTVAEGQSLSIPLGAADPDGDALIFGAIGLPPGCTLGEVAILCSPGFTAAGQYQVRVTASDGGTAGLSDSSDFQLTIADVNRPPVLDPIGNQEVDEGQTLTIALHALDPDGSALALGATGLPGYCTLTDSGAGSGSIRCTPAFGDAGQRTIAVSATELGGSAPASTGRSFVLRVLGVNRPPVLTVHCDAEAHEGLPFVCDLSATDPDGDALTLSASDLPTGGELADHHDGTGRFTWTPADGQAGTWRPSFYATDAGSPARQTLEQIDITVTVANHRPRLDPIGNRNGAEGKPLEFDLSAEDPDGDRLTFSIGSLPKGAALEDHGDGTATFAWTPGFDQAGNHPVTVTVADDGQPVLTDQETLTLSIGDVNRPPVLNHIGDRYGLEGRGLVIPLIASDPDVGDRLSFSCGLPGMTAAVCTDRGDGTGEIVWTPGPDAQGVYPVTVTVTDTGVPPESAAEPFKISIGNVNRAPVLAAIGNQSVQAGVRLVVPLSATDPDGDHLAFNVNGLPAGMTLGDGGSGSATLDWTPGAAAVGGHDLEVVVRDDGRPVAESDAERIRVQVTPAPNPPADLAAIPDQTVIENRLLSLTLSASAAGGGALVYALGAAPPGATLTDRHDGTAEFRWTPPCGASGTYPVTVRLFDGATTLSRSFNVMVTRNPGLGYLRPNYELVSSTWISLFNYDNTYRAAFVSQNGCPLARVTAVLTPTSAFTVRDGTLTFTNVPAQAWVPSQDTFTVRYSKLRGIDPSTFTWTLSQ